MSRLVVITGASRGIGAAIAEHFVGLGDRVVALSRTGDAPEGVLESLELDVTDSQAVTATVKSVVERHGPIEVCVANAGITRDGLILRMTDEQWRDVLSVNLDGVFYTARAVLASMVRNRQGSLVFVGSVSPFMGVAGQANYSAAKAGLVGLARSLAREVARRGVTVNVVAPGLIETDMTHDLGSAKDSMLEMIPAGRIGQPSDIAGVVGFLASNHARYITGVVLSADGGLSLGH